MALLVALLSACGPAALPPGDPARPDIVLVSIDTLRADHLGSYGHARPTSPFLDSLAAEGLRFANARAASPWTLPSHLTMLTGMRPTQHNVVEDDLALAPDAPLIQERLRAAGYATGAFVSTIYVSGAYGFARGFDRYEDYGITERNNLQHPVRVEQVLKDAREWVGEQGGKPIFLFVHLYDVHYPYDPPAPWNEKFDRAAGKDELRYRKYPYYLKNPVPAERMEHLVAQYDESIAWVDDELRKLRAAWTDAGRAATWVVTSDHGEEFGERGSWGHAHTLNVEALHVPLIVAGPGIAPAVREELVGTVDVAPTIAAIAGVELPTYDGVDVRGPVPARPMIADTSRFESARLSLEREGWRLDLDLANRRRDLYDLRADPRESKDLEATETARADTMQEQLLGLVGEPWRLESGSVQTPGFLWQERKLTKHALSTPGRFGLYPPDARVTPAGGAPIDGVHAAPRTGPVRYEGGMRAEEIRISTKTKEQLEALGYVQGEGE